MPRRRRSVGVAFGAVTWGYAAAEALLARRPRRGSSTRRRTSWGCWSPAVGPAARLGEGKYSSPGPTLPFRGLGTRRAAGAELGKIDEGSGENTLSPAVQAISRTSFAERAGDVAAVLGSDYEGTGAADHLTRVGLGQRLAEAGHLARRGDGQGIDWMPRRPPHRGRRRGRDQRAQVGAVAREVDDPFRRAEGRGGSSAAQWSSASPTRSRTARCAAQPSPPRPAPQGVGGIGDPHEVDHRRRPAGRAPFDHGDRDGAARPAGDDREHAGMRKRLGIAFPLQAELVRVDRAGSVDREDQQGVDSGRLGKRRCGGEARPTGRERLRRCMRPPAVVAEEMGPPGREPAQGWREAGAAGGAWSAGNGKETRCPA